MSPTWTGGFSTCLTGATGFRDRTNVVSSVAVGSIVFSAAGADAHADAAEAYLKLGRREEAKRQALEALKRAPTFARAQDLLLAALGRN